MDYSRVFEDLLQKKEYLVIGKRIQREDAIDKVLGKTKYTSDYYFDNMFTIKLLKSTEPHGLIKKIEVQDALGVNGVIGVITAKDIPGVNQIGYAIPDQPLLNDTKVHYIGDPIALVCAEDEYAAEEGVDAIRIEYDPLPPLFEPNDALKPGAPKIHEKGNIAVRTRIRKGDVEKGFKKADAIVEHDYSTHPQDHAYLETEAAVAIPEGSQKVMVIGTMQSPFLVREFTAHVLGYRLNQVRVVQAQVGGAFGGKDDMGPIVCAKAALAATLFHRPAMLVFDREESIVVHPKSFGFRIHYKTGATKDGRLTAAEASIIMDSGAYANRAPFVLWRATAHAAGPYVVPNVHIDGTAVYTNKVYGGSFRGFGDSQIHFAIEQQIDEVAEELGLDPLDFRLKNVLRVGTRTTCNQLIDQSVGIGEILERLEKVSEWSRKRKEYKNYSRRHKSRARGIGVACCYHGISTSTAVPDWSGASVIINEDGSITFRTGICEIGQGSPMGIAEIVAEILGVSLNSIHIEYADTDSILDCHPTHGSRGLMMGGSAAAVAALKLRKRLNKLASDLLECDEKDVEIRDGKVLVKGKPSRSIGFSELAKELYNNGLAPAEYGMYSARKRYLDHKTGLGQVYSVYTYVASVAEVEVDLDTGVVDVLRVYPAVDVGKAIDLMLIEGQLEGGTVQGIGWALSEKLEFEDGKVRNPDFTDYVLPTAHEVPEIPAHVIVEHPYKHSAFGAKGGVGEASMMPIAPAIANAVHHAIGIRVRHMPLTPENVYLTLKGCER